MFSKIIRRLAGRIMRPTPAPQYSLDDERHPINARDGWRRADHPEGRRVRFRISVGDHPHLATPAPPLTGAAFVSGGGGHVNHAEPPKPVARPVPPRTGIPRAPCAETFWTRGR